MNLADKTKERAVSYRLHLALILSVPFLTLLTPAVKERVCSLFISSSITKAYVGDGILIGDSATNIPFTTINWRVTQQPMFGDAFHTVSLFAVPQRVARRHIFRYRSTYASKPFKVIREADMHSVGARRYVYFLPKMYLSRGEEARATINVNVSLDFHTELLTAPVFMFNNSRAFLDFLDMEPGSEEGAEKCSCRLGAAVKYCDSHDRDCIKRDPFACSSLRECQSENTFTSQYSTYYFFTTAVPLNSTVSYEADLTMYFYNTTALEKYYICTIEDTDSCSFSTEGGFIHSRSWRRRNLIIAYTHTTTLSSSTTTQLMIESEVVFERTFLILSVCFLLILYLITRCCFYLLCRSEKHAGTKESSAK